jgi:hypothetical protein
MDAFTKIDEMWFRVEAVIAEGLFWINHVSGSRTSPSWAYTIGFLERGYPELVTVGLSPESSHAFLTWAFDEMRAGVPLAVGREHRRVCWHDLPVSIVELPRDRFHPPSDLALGLFGYYGARGAFPGEPKVCQLVWPDFEGRLPWDGGFDTTIHQYQPLLDEVPWSPHHDHDESECWGCALADDAPRDQG